MEFLQENSAMQKIKNGLKDIKDVTPFINLFDTSFKGWYNTSIQIEECSIYNISRTKKGRVAALPFKHYFFLLSRNCIA